MSRTLPMETCRKRLAVLWLGVAGALVLLVFLQTALGRYEDRVDEAWAWLLPTVMPTLSLIVGVLVMDVTGKAARRRVDPFLYRLAFALSLGYLLLVAGTLLVEPLSGVGGFELMRLSNLWLGPLQGLTAAALGAFFVRRPADDGDAAEAGAPGGDEGKGEGEAEGGAGRSGGGAGSVPR